MDFRYAYLFGDLLFLVIWLGLYAWRKDFRREMLFASVPLGALSIILAQPYMNDWWQPQSISGAFPAIEDFLFGFSTAGIGAVLYEAVFSRRVRLSNRSDRDWQAVRLASIWKYLVFALVGFFFLHYALGLNTFLVTLVVLLAGLSVLAVTRSDLLVDALLSGLTLTCVAGVVYWVIEQVFPGWVELTWSFQNLPRFGLPYFPLDEVVFYFLFGAAIGPLYEYLLEGRMVALTQKTVR